MYNAKDCEQCNSDSVCCYCKNITYYQLEEQLKRKEQECEELKTLKDETYFRLKEEYIQQLNKLKTENEQLKTKVFRFESKQTSMGKQNKELIEDNLNLSKENAKIKAENDELKRLIAKQKNAKIQLSKLKDKQYKEFCNMKQALTEIKDIAENGKRFAESYMITGEQKANVLTYANAILQKISEVEEQ